MFADHKLEKYYIYLLDVEITVDETVSSTMLNEVAKIKIV